MIGLPDGLIQFTDEEKSSILISEQIYAWLIQDQKFGHWSKSPYGRLSFELSSFHGSYIGRFCWNGALWVSIPNDRAVEGFDSVLEARDYIYSSAYFDHLRN